MTGTNIQTMRAVTIDGYGDASQFKLREVPVPSLDDNEVLIKVAFAGVGVWDAKDLKGEFKDVMPRTFPGVLGAEGAGTVVALGSGVDVFGLGDEVYASGLGNPKGGFYAEYAAVPAGQVAKVPAGLGLDQAGALAVPGLTALTGLANTLKVKAGDRLLIFGASGGVGTPAVQLAKAMGVGVLAVVADADSAGLARQNGADVAVNSRTDDLAQAIQSFAPDGLDSVLALVSGDGLDIAIAAVKQGGMVAHPNGVQPVPQGRPGITVRAFNSTPGREHFDRLNALIEQGPFTNPIYRRFDLASVAEAHEVLKSRHTGQIVLTV